MIPDGPPPAELKALRPFIQRGKQYRRVKPAITYHCFFWTVKEILDKKLHMSSSAAGNYAGELMNELELIKKELGPDDELLREGDVAAAYIENHAQELLDRGARQLEQRKANKVTVDCFTCCATLFTLLTSHFLKDDERLDPEIEKKIKYAKYEAARIGRALMKGEDPNPPLPTTPAVSTPDHTESTPSHPPPPPTIEDVPDNYYTSSATYNPAPSFEPSSPPKFVDEHISDAPHDTPTITSTTSTSAPAVEGYFPPVPSIQAPEPGLSPSAMKFTDTSFPDITHADHSYPPALPSPPGPPVQITPSPPGPEETRPNSNSYNKPTLPELPSNVYTGAPSPAAPPPPVSPPVVVPQPQASVKATPIQQAPVVQPVQRKKEVSQEDIAKAMKFARWAISALDYEDVDNAIEQFKKGLEVLGAL